MPIARNAEYVDVGGIDAEYYRETLIVRRPPLYVRIARKILRICTCAD
jgi:hypothetical protein